MLTRPSDAGRLEGTQAAWFAEQMSVPLEQFAFAGEKK